MGIELLIWVIVVVLLIALLVYAVQSMPNIIADPFKSILVVLVILIGVIIIARKAGVF